MATPISKLDQKLLRLQQLTDAMLLARYELDHEQGKLDSCHDFMEQSGNELHDAVDPKLANADFKRSEQELQAIHEQFKNDIAAVKKQRARVRDLQQKLIRMESRHQSRTKKILALRAELRGASPERPSDALTVDIETNTSSSASSIESDTPSLLARYFDRKGDVGIFKERLRELDISHVEDLEGRELIVDRGDTPKVSELQWQQDYKLQRSEILEQLVLAEAECAELEKQCEAAGLQITNLRRNPSSDAISYANANAIGSDQIVLQTTTLQALRSPFVFPLDQPHDTKQASIENWLETVSDPGFQSATNDISTEDRLDVHQDTSPRSLQATPVSPQELQKVSTSSIARSPKSGDVTTLSRFQSRRFEIASSHRRNSDPGPRTSCTTKAAKQRTHHFTTE